MIQVTEDTYLMELRYTGNELELNMIITAFQRTEKTLEHIFIMFVLILIIYDIDKRLIIVCEPYEFTYYKSGATLFEIPYSLIADYTAEGGAVDIIMSETGG